MTRTLPAVTRTLAALTTCFQLPMVYEPHLLLLTPCLKDDHHDGQIQQFHAQTRPAAALWGNAAHFVCKHPISNNQSSRCHQHRDRMAVRSQRAGADEHSTTHSHHTHASRCLNAKCPCTIGWMPQHATTHGCVGFTHNVQGACVHHPRPNSPAG